MTVVDAPDARIFEAHIGLTGKPIVSAPLDADTLRRFVQAIMDDDAVYYEPVAAARYGGISAPPLYPVHAMRLPPRAPDPLRSIELNPDADGTGDLGSTLYGLPPINGPYKRLLNGGNEIEFHRCLRIGECAVATPCYKNITLKPGKTGALLIVVIETRFTTESDELLLVNRQTVIWR